MTLEPRKSCQFCHRKFRITRWKQHESFCEFNPNRKAIIRRVTQLCEKCGRPKFNIQALTCAFCTWRGPEFEYLEALIRLGYGDVPQVKIPEEILKRAAQVVPVNLHSASDGARGTAPRDRLHESSVVMASAEAC